MIGISSLAMVAILASKAIETTCPQKCSVTSCTRSICLNTVIWWASWTDILQKAETIQTAQNCVAPM